MALITDIRYAIRLLARSPLFTLTSALSLSVGIAATSAIFSLADALLLRPRIGVVEPGSVVDIGRTVRGSGFDNFGYPLFTVLRDRNTTLQTMAASRWDPNVMSLGTEDGSERMFVTLVSGNYFDVLGTRPAAGRFFLAEEDRTAGTHPVVVLSYGYWQRRFDGDRTLVGRAIRLNGLSFTVVGVTQPGFTGAGIFDSDAWAPMAMEQHVRASDTSLLTHEGAVWHTAIGRLQPGVTVSQASHELDAIAKAYLRDRGDDRADRWGIAALSSERVPGPGRTPVRAFIAMLGTLTILVLLIACSNVASMLLARALQRRREVATRLAVGASRRRIISQLLVEGLTLATLAAAVSVPVTVAIVELLAAFQPQLPLPLLLDLRVDPRVMGFALGLSALATVGFALLPALQSTRFELAPALHGANATVDRRRAWLRHALVGGQVAMTLLLLVASGLFLRSLQQAASVDKGFAARHVDTVQIDVSLAGYRGDEGVRVADELADRFRAVPGVVSVGYSRMVPLMSGRFGLGNLRVNGYQGPDGRDRVDANWDIVSPDYFRTLSIPIVRGRSFTDGDRRGAPDVAIVNERFAEHAWPGRDPIGQQVFQGAQGSERALQIVGVARNAKYAFLTEDTPNFIYVPEAQQFATEVNFHVLRAGGESQIAVLRDVVRTYNRQLPIVDAQPLEQLTTIALLPQRIAAWIAGGVGAVGLLLAAIGLYGLTAFSVAQRTREIAVRMALGATRESVVSLVLRQSARLALIGGAIGLALAIGVSLLLRRLLIGIQPIDAVTFAIATAVLTGVLLIAAWTPARRAAAMDPMRALRSE